MQKSVKASSMDAAMGELFPLTTSIGLQKFWPGQQTTQARSWYCWHSFWLYKGVMDERLGSQCHL